MAAAALVAVCLSSDGAAPGGTPSTENGKTFRRKPLFTRIDYQAPLPSDQAREGMAMVTLIFEAFFALVFVQSLIGYGRRRDTLQRDLAFVFAPMTVLLVLEIIRRVAGAAGLPAILELLGLTLLLAQAYLTLRLVGAVRPVRRLVSWSAFALFVVTTVPW